jgi:molybdenum cofactor cytidylyltransferase
VLVDLLNRSPFHANLSFDCPSVARERRHVKARYTRRMSVAAILLAAGASRRLGRPKQLLLVNGETLLARNVRIARAAGVSPVFVVLGAERNRIHAAIEVSGAIAVENPHWQSGLASSICEGVAAVEARLPMSDGVLLMNCDQPRLDTPHLSALLSAFESTGREAIAASSYAGTSGVPAVFPARFFAQLKALAGDKGARTLFAQNSDALVTVPFEGGEIDIDTPEDLTHLT